MPVKLAMVIILLLNLPFLMLSTTTSGMLGKICVENLELGLKLLIWTFCLYQRLQMVKTTSKWFLKTIASLNFVIEMVL